MRLNKGFTLIELLAVIVVLAIIALIATPIILNVIETSKKGSAESSMLGYVDAIEKNVMLSKLNTSSTEIEAGTYTAAQLKSLNVVVKGDKPDDTSVFIINSKGQVTEGWATYHNGEYKVYYNGKYAIADKNNYLDKKGEKHDTIPEPGTTPEEDPYTIVYSAAQTGITVASEGVADYKTLNRFTFVRYTFLNDTLTKMEACLDVGNDPGRLFCVEPGSFNKHNEYINEYGAASCDLTKAYNSSADEDDEMYCGEDYTRSGIEYYMSMDLISHEYGAEGAGAKAIARKTEGSSGDESCYLYWDYDDEQHYVLCTE